MSASGGCFLMQSLLGPSQNSAGGYDGCAEVFQFWQEWMWMKWMDLWKIGSMCDVHLVGSDDKAVPVNGLLLALLNDNMRTKLEDFYKRKACVHVPFAAGEDLAELVNVLFTGKPLTAGVDLDKLQRLAEQLGFDEKCCLFEQTSEPSRLEEVDSETDSGSSSFKLGGHSGEDQAETAESDLTQEEQLPTHDSNDDQPSIKEQAEDQPKASAEAEIDIVVEEQCDISQSAQLQQAQDSNPNLLDDWQQMDLDAEDRSELSSPWRSDQKDYWEETVIPETVANPLNIVKDNKVILDSAEDGKLIMSSTDKFMSGDNIFPSSHDEESFFHGVDVDENIWNTSDFLNVSFTMDPENTEMFDHYLPNDSLQSALLGIESELREITACDDDQTSGLTSPTDNSNWLENAENDGHCLAAESPITDQQHTATENTLQLTLHSQLEFHGETCSPHNGSIFEDMSTESPDVVEKSECSHIADLVDSLTFGEELKVKEPLISNSSAEVVNSDPDSLLEAKRLLYEEETLLEKNRIQCLDCGAFSPVVMTTLLKNPQQIQNVKFRCRDCTVHRQTFHPGPHSAECSDDNFACDGCAKTFAVISELRIHQTSQVCNVKLLSCRICKQEFASRNSLNSHYTLVHKRAVTGPSVGAFECPICNKVFQGRPHFAAHLRRHKQRFTCPQCDYSCPDRKKFKKHMFDVHAVPASKNPVPQEEANRATFMCAKCPATFKSSARLQCHLEAVHLKVCRYWCPTKGCNYGSYWKTDLDNHVKVHIFPPPISLRHSDRVACWCDQCGQEFRCLKSLGTHQRRKHFKKT